MGDFNIFKIKIFNTPPPTPIESFKIGYVRLYREEVNPAGLETQNFILWSISRGILLIIVLGGLH